MKKIWILLLAVAALSCRPVFILPEGERYPLSEKWQLSRNGGNQACTADVPATVAGALAASGYYGNNLMEAKNYADADRSIFDDTWIWTKKFDLDKSQGSHYELNFEGLGYYADIFFNGKQIASSDTTFGVFITRSYDVTDLLKGSNTVEVKLRRAQKGDLNIGFVDWNPRPLDESMGIVRPVSIHVTGPVSIGDVYVVPNLNTETLSSADLDIRVTLRNFENREVSGNVTLKLEGVGQAAVPVTLAPNATTQIRLSPEQVSLLHLENPRVWWSYDLGSPELYNLTTGFEENGKVSDVKETVFGVRKIESRMIGENYRQFTLNGKDVLIKGAGWTDDIFLMDTPESLERQVNYVKDMNLNCIRFENIWGKDDLIYDLCDRLGILAIVGFSCQWEWEDYCGLPEVKGYGCINTPETEDLAVKYFHDQVVRLHNHPAVIGWMTGSDRIPNPRLEPRYLEIFAAEDYRPYINSAKNQKSSISGWSGTKMEGPYDWVGPDYWYFDTKAGGAFGFNTETGIGANIPQLESIKRMIPADKLWPLSDVWDYHCTASSSCMNNMATLVKTINDLYGESQSLEDFMIKAHAVDYDGTKGMYEAFRVNLPNTTGIVQWMLNSAWPSIYWQQYDWYGVPTAGYYGTKKACEPEQLFFNYGDRKVYFVGEKPGSRELTARIAVYDANSKLLGEHSAKIVTSYRQSEAVCSLAQYDGAPHFVSLELVDANGDKVADNFYAIPAKDNQYVFKKTNWYYTPISDSADLSFAFGTGPAKVECNFIPAGDGVEVTLVNKGDNIVPMNILKAYDKDGNLIVPAIWSDNFFAMMPGQTRKITCKVAAEDIRIELINK